MALALLTKRTHTTPIGLDLGTTTVRAVQLERRRDTWTLVHHHRCERAAGGDVAATLAAAVSRCLAHGNFRGTRVHAALAAEDYEVHALELPAKVLAADDRTSALIVENEVRRLMTLTEPEVEVRHWTLPATSAASAPNAMGAVAPRAAVTGLLDCLGAGGAVCESLDMSAWALARVGHAVASWADRELWGALDLGHGQSRLALCIGAAPVLIRNVGEGGHTWTKRIAESLKVSEKSAEVHKREHGIPASADQQGDSELAGMVLSALRTDLQRLAAQVKRSFEFVLSCYPQHRATGLLLAGGGARMKNIDTHLRQTLGISVQTVSAAMEAGKSRLTATLPKRESLEDMATAIGLAMGEGDDVQG